VDRITALVPAEVVKTVCEPAAAKQRPANDYDARFSVPYVVAAALQAGRFGLAELEASALRNPSILALAAKVDYAIDPQSTFPRHYCGELVVRTKDGRELRHREAANRGCADRPLTNAEVEAKFADNAAFADSGRAKRIRDAVLALDEVPARAFEDALAA
jgi:2-methylcitrate dehydratase PrpD